MACGCADVCNCFLTDTETVSITGNGTSGTPYQATVIPDPTGGLENTPNGVGILLDPASDAPVSTSAAGLKVDCCPATVVDSDTIDFSTPGGSVSGDVIVDPDATNLLSASGAGLLATLNVQDSSSVDFTGDGSLANPLTAAVVPGGVQSVPPGVVTSFAGTVEPAGWLMCDGALYTVAAEPNLYAVIGNQYGGTPAVDFNVPDLRGRVDVGLDNMGGVDAGRLTVANTLGGSGGEQNHLNTAAESGMPAHFHGTPTARTIIDTPGSPGFGLTIAAAFADRVIVESGAADVGTNTDVAGPLDAAAAHNNLQPYMLLNKIIKT